MSSQFDRASNALFPTDGGRVSNVKFFLGYNRAVTREQIAGEFNRAEAQVRADGGQRSIALTDI